MIWNNVSFQGLYSDILKSPKDDLPRLMFADALEETGQDGYMAWAEFIRIQIAAWRNLEIFLSEGMKYEETEECKEFDKALQDAKRRTGESGWSGPVANIGFMTCPDGYTIRRADYEPVDKVDYARGFASRFKPYQMHHLFNGPAIDRLKELFARYPIAEIVCQDRIPRQSVDRTRHGGRIQFDYWYWERTQRSERLRMSQAHHIPQIIAYRIMSQATLDHLQSIKDGRDCGYLGMYGNQIRFTTSKAATAALSDALLFLLKNF